MTTLRLEDVSVSYGSESNALMAVREVTIEVPHGKTVGLVGESGCGKSTLAKAAVGMLPLASGRVLIGGEDVTVALRRRRGVIAQRVQLIFQDPRASLNPRMTVGETLAEAVATHHQVGRAALRTEVSRLLELVGLGDRALQRRPVEFSGGQLQRIAIARALAVKPLILIADEITSALDVSVQASILNLLKSIQVETGVGCLFISHDLAVVRYVSDQVAVMNLGKIVEKATAEDIFRDPKHPYTKVLLDSIPRLTSGAGGGEIRALREPVDPHKIPAGCGFHTRCPVGPEADQTREQCRTSDPKLVELDRGRLVACHFARSAASNDPATEQSRA